MTTISRNDLCPCQSGKEYKHCCFAHQTIRADFAATVFDVARALAMQRLAGLTNDPQATTPHFDRLIDLLPQAFLAVINTNTAQGSINDEHKLTPFPNPQFALSLQLPKPIVLIRFQPGIELNSSPAGTDTQGGQLITGLIAHRYAAQGLELYPIIMADPGFETALTPIACTDLHTPAPAGALHWPIDQSPDLSGEGPQQDQERESLACLNGALLIIGTEAITTINVPTWVYPPQGTPGTLGYIFPEILNSYIDAYHQAPEHIAARSNMFATLMSSR